MAETRETTAADQQLKAAHRAIWALGDYPSISEEVIPDLGAVLVEACRVEPGMTVLDVAAGSGNAAIPAALTGAHVTACDLTPELLEAGRRAAARRGATLEWSEGDAEALTFADDAFDVVLSCVGVMFAPHHQASADELLRVCRPGGTIGLTSWTPEGFVGEMFTAMKPYAAPSPEGVQPPLRWGSEDYVRGLFGDRVVDVKAERQMVTVDCFADPKAFREGFRHRYGPTVAAYRGITHKPEQVALLDHELDALAGQHDRGADWLVMDWEYLLFTARKRA